MKSVAFEQTGRVVDVHTTDNILKALLAEEIPVKQACGGRGLCATCHVYIDNGKDALTPVTKREKRTLERLGEVDTSSRLACQARVLRDVSVRLPEGLFIETTADLHDLIGRRAEQRILHPIDGRVLVEVGKIITRSTVKKLEHVELDVQQVMKESKDVV